jgi:carbonic anhydrase
MTQLAHASEPDYLLAHGSHVARPALAFTVRVAFVAALTTFAGSALASEDTEAIPLKSKKPLLGSVSTSSAANPREAGDKVREALGTGIAPHKKLKLTVTGKNDSAGTTAPTSAGSTFASPASTPASTLASRQYARARAIALGEAASPGAALGTATPWAYTGDAGPNNWGRLRPEYTLCASGKRQSPVHIQSGSTLLGPAEPVQFNFEPGDGTVINTGRGIVVDVRGSNTISLRAARYQLVQLEFHAPSEIQIDGKRAAMSAHLIHRNDEGQLAIVVVLMEAGDANALIDKVWTYMPLDVNDRVRMPPGLLNLNELLPVDQRYYQFMGSLSTPPCTEGVLWVVLKTPLTVSPAQLRLFTQLYPMNARPVQALNDRPLREAQ